LLGTAADLAIYLLQDVDVEPSFQTNMKVRSYESTINAYHVGSVGKKI
jgi:hypothetical protein